jgi:hypothetical protein
MPDPELTPWQRLVLAFWALFAVLFRPDVARGVDRVRTQHRLARAGALPPQESRPSRPAPHEGVNGKGQPRPPERGRAPPPPPVVVAEPAPALAAPAAAAAPKPAPAPAPAARAEPDQRAALQVLAVLQREGRLVDFLEEDLAGFPDASIGAAARTVHAGCKKAIEELFRLEPVFREREGDRVTVKPGFDPSAVRLTGNVVGQPPFQGALRHHGWRAKEVKLPPLDGKDATILAPAEVEL